MKTLRTPIALASLAALLACPAARALEVTAGDYEVLPAGINLGLLYFQHAETSRLYAGGRPIARDFRIASDVTLARYIHPIRINERTTMEWQAVLPFGELRGGGSAGVLGRTGGTADLILGLPIKFLIDPVTRNAFSIGSFLYLPTGSYDAARPLNLGENRFKGLLQLAYVGHYGSRWALDAVGDVQVSGKNDDYGPLRGTRRQAPRYEFQLHGRYIVSATTSFSTGVGHYVGGENRIDGIAQNDSLRTTYGRLTATHFVTPATQLQVQLGRDLAVEEGARERTRINLRIAQIF